MFVQSSPRERPKSWSRQHHCYVQPPSVRQPRSESFHSFPQVLTPVRVPNPPAPFHSMQTQSSRQDSCPLLFVSTSTVGGGFQMWCFCCLRESMGSISRRPGATKEKRHLFCCCCPFFFLLNAHKTNGGKRDRQTRNLHSDCWLSFK